MLPLQASWKRHHGHWEYRFWTDADNLAFLTAHYPEFLPIYQGYASPICRADAIRYFLLYHFGGLYADLDFECLRPFDALLEGKGVVLGLEPDAHLGQHKHFEHDRIVCNALMASRPGHPFWRFVIDLLKDTSRHPGPLDATGPYLLTRAVAEYRGEDAPELLSASVLYPITSDQSTEGQLFDLKFFLQAVENAHAMHHWAGTWWRTERVPDTFATAVAQVQLVDHGMPAGALALQLRTTTADLDAWPTVSCLMVTGSRPAQARLAIAAFCAQTYPNKELVILDDGADDTLAEHVQALADARVRHIRVPASARTLGALRNQAVALASGEYICQWDDDDLYDPARLSTQMAVLRATASTACLLSRWLVWWPAQQRLAVSPSRPWEGSLLCAKAALPTYADLARGEDTPVIDTLLQSQRVALLDQARLYLYVRHERNAFGAAHSEQIWEAASLQVPPDRYDTVLDELGKRVDIANYLQALDGPEPDPVAAAPVGIASAQPAEAAAPAKSTVDAPDIPGQPRPLRLRPDECPSVLVLTPVRNVAALLPGFFEQLLALEYPQDRLSLAFIDGASDDNTLPELHALCQQHGPRFARTNVISADYGFQFITNRKAPEHQFERRAILARSRNELFRRAFQGETWILWLDADVVAYPADVLMQLLRYGKRVITPHCVLAPGGPSYDLNSFRFKPNAAAQAWEVTLDGIMQPPRGLGRQYLEDFRGQELVELSAVGGTMLLVDARIHQAGFLFPDYSYRGLIETEGFAARCRDSGIASWGLPDLEIVHATP
ncbi:glycosyltransferase [Thiohalocapsa marina]|nr:glycosyltransferase [Thiohalocapsa marina]